MTPQDFIRAIRECRGFTNAKIETKLYGDGKRMAVIVSGTPSEFPLVRSFRCLVIPHTDPNYAPLWQVSQVT